MVKRSCKMDLIDLNKMVLISLSLFCVFFPLQVAERVRRQRTSKKIRAKAPVTKNAMPPPSDKWRAAGESSGDNTAVRTTTAAEAFGGC